ncbi:MAG: hypothetical protein GY941_22770 [Planctomycetes bacterium]|nr:hypothetical protein [Planctomycetota bacterium]
MMEGIKLLDFKVSDEERRLGRLGVFFLLGKNWLDEQKEERRYDREHD